MNRDVLSVLVAYPQIWHACHTHHQRRERSGDPLTEREASLLVHISAFAPASPQVVARHLGIAKATFSEAVTPLIDRGLVRREQRASDRRHHALTLTKAGERAVMQGSVLDAARVRRVLQRLSATERRRAVEGMALLGKACRP